MKRFPFWLRAELLRARWMQGLHGGAKRNLILQLDPADHRSFHVPPDNGHSPATKTEAELLNLVQASAAPVVWIGGGEPLAHPGTGRLARRIVDCGRTVFLETDGFFLRQRIHEFRPVSRLFLTLKFSGLQRSNDLRAGRDGVFARACEGMRTAKLSGFLICGHILLDGATDLREVVQLKEQLLAMDVDGLFVSAAPSAFSGENHDREIVSRKVTEARKIVESHGWGGFSLLLEKESQNVPENARRTVQDHRTAQPAADVEEEGVEVQ